MKLKKLMAVALAATTALTSGVAYDTIGASVAEAGNRLSEYQTVGEVLTCTAPNGITYSFTVTNPILNGDVGKNAAPKSEDGATNGIYEDGDLVTNYKFADNSDDAPHTLSAVSSGGFVKLTSVTIPSDMSSSDVTLMIPEEISTKNGFTPYSWTTSKIKAGCVYKVTAIDLNGDNTTYADQVKKVYVTSGMATQVSSFKVDAFKNLDTIGQYTYTGSYDSSKANDTTTPYGFTVTNDDATPCFAYAGTIDVSGTKLKMSEAKKLFDPDQAKLETLDLSSLDKTAQTTTTSGAYNDDETLDLATTSGTLSSKIKSVNISENPFLKEVKFNAFRNGGAALNISNDNAIEVLEVDGWEDGTDEDDNSHVGYRGIKFITDGSTETSDVDLSFINSAKTIKITDARMRTFSSPSFAKDANGELDVRDNLLTSVSLSSAANATKVNVSYNKLLEADISGLAEASEINVSYNYLTALDASSLDNKKPTITMDHNFISSDNLTKTDKQTNLSLGTQKEANLFRWSYAGDMGQASGSTSKAYIKLGGTGTLAAGMIFYDVPQGFAEKLVGTTSWKEANSAETSAIALGESATVQAIEDSYDVDGTCRAIVVLSSAVTANATKAAAEKVTFQYGATRKDINIANDSVVLVNYDVASGIESENIKTKNDNNKENIAYAYMMFPTEAFILNSSGSVDATLTSKKPIAWPEHPETTYKHEGYDTEYDDNAWRRFDGVTFTKWNTMVDGSGTAVASGAKLKAISEDTTVYANYTENTYNVSYGVAKPTSPTVNTQGSTGTQSNIKYGEDHTLNTNGFTTAAGNFYGWRFDQSTEGRYISDGQTVNGLGAWNKKTESKRLEAMYGDANHYINLGVSSIDLVVGDAKDGYYLKGDLKPVVTGEPSRTRRDLQSGPDLGFGSGFYNYYSSDLDVVSFKGDYIVAKGAGTANVYVRDTYYGNIATVSVTVQSKEEAEAAELAKKEAAAANKAIEAGEKTDVSKFSKFAATIVKNADGENTVTVTKGKNVATAKINTITIGDKTYTVTRIGANAYKGMSKLKTVTTSNQVKVVGKAAFANCKKLTKVTLGKKVSKIGANAFKGDKKLAKIMIKSKKLTTKAKVGKNSFKGIKATAKFYIAKKAATYKKVKKAIKAQSGAPKKAKYVKKYA